MLLLVIIFLALGYKFVSVEGEYGPFEKGKDYSSYCPNALCENHTMCLNGPNFFYDLGPDCSNGIPVRFSEEQETLIINLINAVRSKIARGREVGKNKVKLPRAYGMRRVKWDNQLATLAQITANRCLFRRDICRSTYRFPNPSQLVSVVRFAYPSWGTYVLPKDTREGEIEPNDGFNSSKIDMAIKDILSSWYSGKWHATPHDFERCNFDRGDFEAKKNTTDPVIWYLQLIHGTIVGIGCGVSAYTSYHNTSTIKAERPYNLVQIVCNLSEMPELHRPLINLTPPPNSSACGCPPHMTEDALCLCSSNETDIENYDDPYDNKPINKTTALAELTTTTIPKTTTAATIIPLTTISETTIPALPTTTSTPKTNSSTTITPPNTITEVTTTAVPTTTLTPKITASSSIKAHTRNTATTTKTAPITTPTPKIPKSRPTTTTLEVTPTTSKTTTWKITTTTTEPFTTDFEPEITTEILTNPIPTNAVLLTSTSTLKPSLTTTKSTSTVIISDMITATPEMTTATPEITTATPEITTATPEMTTSVNIRPKAKSSTSKRETTITTFPSETEHSTISMTATRTIRHTTSKEKNENYVQTALHNEHTTIFKEYFTTKKVHTAKKVKLAGYSETTELIPTITNDEPKTENDQHTTTEQILPLTTVEYMKLYEGEPVNREFVSGSRCTTTSAPQHSGYLCTTTSAPKQCMRHIQVEGTVIYRAKQRICRLNKKNGQCPYVTKPSLRYGLNYGHYKPTNIHPRYFNKPQTQHFHSQEKQASESAHLQNSFAPHTITNNRLFSRVKPAPVLFANKYDRRHRGLFAPAHELITKKKKFSGKKGLDIRNNGGGLHAEMFSLPVSPEQYASQQSLPNFYNNVENFIIPQDSPIPQKILENIRIAVAKGVGIPPFELKPVIVKPTTQYMNNHDDLRDHYKFHLRQQQALLNPHEISPNAIEIGLRNLSNIDYDLKYPIHYKHRQQHGRGREEYDQQFDRTDDVDVNYNPLKHLTKTTEPFYYDNKVGRNVYSFDKKKPEFHHSEESLGIQHNARTKYNDFDVHAIIDEQYTNELNNKDSKIYDTNSSPSKMNYLEYKRLQLRNKYGGGGHSGRRYARRHRHSSVLKEPIAKPSLFDEQELLGAETKVDDAANYQDGIKEASPDYARSTQTPLRDAGSREHAGAGGDHARAGGGDSSEAAVWMAEHRARLMNGF